MESLAVLVYSSENFEIFRRHGAVAHTQSVLIIDFHAPPWQILPPQGAWGAKVAFPSGR